MPIICFILLGQKDWGGGTNAPPPLGFLDSNLLSGGWQVVRSGPSCLLVPPKKEQWSTKPHQWVELWDIESLCTAYTLAAIQFLVIVYCQTFCSVLGRPWGSVWKAGSSDVSAPPSERNWGGTPPAASKPHREPWLLTASCPEALQSPPQAGLAWKAVAHNI